MPAPPSVREIAPGDRRGAAAFERFPFGLYRGHPTWVPHLRSEVLRSMNRRRHPFYRRGEAAFLLAEREGRAVGRLSVHENRGFNDYRGRRDAFFYYFDAEDDLEVAAALFAAAVEWARSRGLTRLVGPKGFLPAEGFGVLIEGFEHLPGLGVPYNYPYYAGLLEGAGFEKEVDFISGSISIDRHAVPQQFLDAADAVAGAQGYEFKEFRNRRELRRFVPRIAGLYNRTFTENWEYWPLSDEEALAVFGRVAAIAEPDLILVMLHRGEPVGFLFIIPNISVALQRCRGRLLPFGWFRILRERSRTTAADLLGIGLVPEHRGTGANAVFYAAIGRGAPETRFRSAELIQVEETNLPIVSNLDAIGVDWIKRHRIYRKSLV